MTSSILLVLSLLAMLSPSLVRRVEAIAWTPLRRPRPWVAYVGVGALALLGSAGLAALTGIPFPWIHDEFSHLLLADTFAEGRLANPAHPLWPHFESFHILQQPTYASKYPPAPGIPLALGQVLLGHPIAGVWLSAALASASLLWALRQWLPPRWALVGALLFALHVAVPSYWSHSYWGGHIAVVGGALVVGAVRRLMREPGRRDALIGVAGLGILANSRPFEGLILACVVALLLGVAIARAPGRYLSRRVLLRSALPALAALLAIGAAMALYNERVTGDFTKLPTVLYEEQYQVTPIFTGVDEPERDTRSGPVGGAHAQKQVNPENLPLLAELAERVAHMADWLRGFYLPRGYVLGVLAVPLLLVRARSRLPVLLLALCLAASLVPYWFFPHYVAPYTVLVYLVLVECLRRLRPIRLAGRPFGRALVAGLLLAALWDAGAEIVHRVRRDERHLDRERAIEPLRHDPTPDLVFVRYGEGHEYHREWVYNRADIDAAQVIWARDLGAERNRQLLAYYPDREAWLLTYTSDEDEVTLVPYE